MRILLATDAWHPQVNGVVRTWTISIDRLRTLGHEVAVIEPNALPGFPCPFYPEVRLCRPGRREVVRRIQEFSPDAIHIATEGPVGLAVRAYCQRRRLFFTTSYHTRFPEYLQRMVGLPTRWSYAFMKWFHRPAAAMLVATPSLEAELRDRGFAPPIRRWSRGVDLALFHPRPKTLWPDWPRPVLLYAGRVSVEKGIEDFLTARAPGTKVVVGDGPVREKLAATYPDVKFLGYRTGAALAECYANADLFVFPSVTDTFGLVMIEALASGLPVAAHPVTGPIDIITRPALGALDNDLGAAIKKALEEGDPAECVRAAREYTWDNCTGQLLGSLIDARTGERAKAVKL